MAVFEIATFSTLAKLLLAARKLATDTDPLNRTKALADLAQNGKALKASITGTGLSKLAQEMETRASAIDSYLTHEGTAKEDARLIFWQVVPHALADPMHLTGAALKSDEATEAMVRAIHDSPLARDFRQTTYAENYFRKVMTGTLRVMLVEKEYIDSITPALWRQSLENQGIQIEWLERLDTKLDAQTRLIETLRADLVEMKDAAAAQAAGVSEKALFRLVQPIAENITDRDEALLALQEAVQIARRVQEEGHQSSNLGEFFDTVLRRVTALSGEGAHETAISELDAALAQEEAESAARKVRLLTAAVDQHLLAFDAEGAAAKIARRVDLETPDPGAHFDALRDERRIWYERGRDKGLNLDLRVAIALAEITRDRADSPNQKGVALNYLGAALSVLGERESGTDRLEEAVVAFRAALEEHTRDRVPLDWAITQTNLGFALWTLGQRESGTDRLEEAVAAYRAALEEGTRDRVPLDWATTQMNLGNALKTLGERESGTDRLEGAVAAYRAALEELTRDRVPLDWAVTQMNLGNALKTLGERERGTDRLEEAVAAFRAALEEYTRDRVPLLDWAKAQMNLGNALRVLGERERGTDRLEEAVAAYRAALEEHTRDRVPLDWATTQMNLGNALQALGQRESGTDRLEEAVAAYRAALEELTRDRVPLYWAKAQMNLGNALQTLGQRESGTDRFEEAVAAYRAALEELTRDRVPLDWAMTRGNVANVHIALFDKTSDAAELDRAQAALDDAQAVFAKAEASQYLAITANIQAVINARRGV